MALYEYFTVVADEYPVGGATTTGTNVVEGSIVRMNTSGKIILPEAAGTYRSSIIGIAGDTKQAVSGQTPYASNVIVNPDGGTRGTVNRVSDMYDETGASGLITVYHSGGKFATDQIDATVTSSLNAGTLLSTDADGKLTTSGNNATNAIAMLVGVGSGALPMGVPGTNGAGSNDMGMGTYAIVKLLV
jgi:hypothetical protein